MQSDKLWNIRFVQLLVIETLFYFGAYLTNPVVSGYALLLGASVALAGFIAGLSASMALVARPFMGLIADRFSKKSLLATSAVLFMVATFGCAASTTPAALVFFRSIQGIAFAFRSVSVIAMVSLVVPHEHLGKAVGWTGMAQTVSCAVGPMIASSMVALLGYESSFISAGVLFLVGLAIIVAFRAPAAAAGAKNADGSSRKFSLLDFVYVPGIPITVVAGLAMVPHGSAISLILLAGEERGIVGISLYFAIYSVAAFILRPLVGQATDRYPLRFVIVPVLVVEIGATVILAFMDSLFMAALGGLCMGIGQATAYSALQAEGVRHAQPEELGRASNMFYIGPDVGMGLGPTLSGAVMQAFGVTAMFLTCGFLVFVGLCVFLVYDWKRRLSAAE